MSLYEKRGLNYYNESYERAQNKKKFAIFLRSVMAGDEQAIDWNTDARMLFDAIRKGKLHMIRFILEAAPGDLANSIDIKGKTPLMVSCTIKEELRRSMTVRLLISSGADVNLADDNGRTVLSHSCEMRCNDVVDLLVRHHNIDPEIPDNNGNTALMYSAVVGNDVATDILLRHFRRLGLNVDRQNADGFTALLLAAKYGNITCARILIEQGRASLRHRDRNHGYSAEDWLKKNGFTLEDVTPLTMRLRQKAMYMRSMSSRSYSVPQERHVYGHLDDDEDGSAIGCFNTRRQVERQFPRKYPVDLNPLHDSTINELDLSYRRPKSYSKKNPIDNEFHVEHTSTPYSNDGSLCSEPCTSTTYPDIKPDNENTLKLPDIKIQRPTEKSFQRQNMLNSDFKTRCPEKVPENDLSHRSRSSQDLRRWQPHFDDYSLDTQETFDDMPPDPESDMHDMLD